MLGICPNCKIDLKENSDNKRITNEVMLVLKYREMVERGCKPRDIKELGYCELCNATIDDISLLKNPID